MCGWRRGFRPGGEGTVKEGGEGTVKEGGEDDFYAKRSGRSDRARNRGGANIFFFFWFVQIVGPVDAGSLVSKFPLRDEYSVRRCKLLGAPKSFD
jgi:hypothetical protein